MGKNVLSAAQKFAIWGKGRSRELPYDAPGDPMVTVAEPKAEPEPAPDEEECVGCTEDPPEPERPAFLAPPKKDYVRKTKANATSPDVVLTTSTVDELDDD